MCSCFICSCCKHVASVMAIRSGYTAVDLKGLLTLLCVISTCCPSWWSCLLTPWCRVLLEKLTGLQLVRKFPAFHGTRRFFTANTSVRHLSLSWASPTQSIYPRPTPWRSVLILSTHLRLGTLMINYDVCDDLLVTSSHTVSSNGP